MFRLAGHLGKSVDWIEKNISSKELTEWQAYYNYIEPFGNKFVDSQFSSLRLQNYNGDEKRSIEDFYLYNYNLKTPEQIEKEELELAEKQAKIQADNLKAFFRGKVGINTE